MKKLLRLSLMLVLAGGLFAGLATATSATILAGTPFPQCPKPPQAGIR